MKKLSELQKMLVIAAIVSVALALLALIPLFVAHQPGWLIGVGIGSAIEIVNIYLLYKGSEVALKNLKTYQFLLFYFSRMALFLVGLLVVAIFSYGFLGKIEPVPAFKNAIWGLLIAYTPMQIVVIAVMLKNKKSIVTISEKEEDEEK